MTLLQSVLHENNISIKKFSSHHRYLVFCYIFLKIKKAPKSCLISPAVVRQPNMKARIPTAISEWAARAIYKRLKANQGKAEGGAGLS